MDPDRDLVSDGSDAVDLPADYEAGLDNVIDDMFESAPSPGSKTPSKKPKAKKEREPEPEDDPEQVDEWEYEGDFDEEGNDYYEDEDSADDGEYDDDEEYDDEEEEELDPRLAAMQARIDELENARREQEREAREAEQARQAEAEIALWDNKKLEFRAWQRRERQKILLASRNKADPQGFIDRHLEKLDEVSTNWLEGFEAKRESRKNASLTRVVAEAFAAKMARRFDLTDEDETALADFAEEFPNPKLVKNELSRILADKQRNNGRRSSRRRATTQAKSVAREMSRKMPRPGRGAKVAKEPQTLDELVNRLNLPKMP